jgi:hypothetical protein
MVHASLGFINILLAVQRSQTIGIAAEDHWLAYLRFFRAIFIQHDIRIGVEPWSSNGLIQIAPPDPCN